MFSRNFPPSADLAPFVRRHYVFAADLPADFTIMDRLLSETAFVRILLHGDWAAQMDGDAWSSAGNTVLFGANAHPLPVRVRGPFKVAGFSIKPGGWSALFQQPANLFTDRMLPLQASWPLVADKMFADVAAAADDDGIVAAMEAGVRAQLAQIGKMREDMLITRYESIARLDSAAKVEDVSASLGLSVRQLERRCLHSFGMSPKAVFRRARFLDMAMAMRGFSNPSETQLATLRYFDQSHLNREFRTFVQMTPGQFRKSETPLMTAGLKLRSEGEFLFTPE